ncbi:hypothetical protein POV27_19550 [Aureisphaera galaxeae]|uniref:hypothetical protein n=1 Tax=Aureisphaera galaxeae TaxID=1538023 RepID=UPI00234FDBCA|nr:hypothetical protein [Aureisphaera galaxeae]MDC8006258.1 hypothetical protein [Aureisphaera galaxeae]
MNSLKKKLDRYILVLLLLSVSLLSAQTSSTERFTVGKDALVTVNTSHTNITFETWDKDFVEVEAFIDDESLSEEEKKVVFENWDLKVYGNSKEVIVSSNEGSLWGGIESMKSLKALDRMKGLEALKSLEGLKEIKIQPLLSAFEGMDFNIVVPEIPEVSGIPKWPFSDSFAGIKEKDGSYNFSFGDHGARNNFDRQKYEKDKQAYVNKLNKKYGTSVSVREVDVWLEDVDKWKEEFGKVMEEWGENFGRSFELNFGEDFEKDMEKWGEEFGKSMEEWGEEFGKDMEKWGEEFGKDMEKWAEQFEKDAEKWAEQFDNYDTQVITSPNGDKSIIINGGKKGGLFDEPVKAKKTIIIRMPKNTRTDINVRHGEVKMADAYNTRAKLDYSTLTANSIDGGETLINAAYAPVYVNNWKAGALELKYVDDCKLNTVNRISLEANSSNVNVNAIVENAFLSGSFGSLYIKEIDPSFKSVDIVLENTDALLDLPNSSFSFQYTGKKSRFESPNSIEITSKNKNTSHTMLKGYKGAQGSPRSLTINASYSNVTFNN